jgi:hypothetical protein
MVLPIKPPKSLAGNSITAQGFVPFYYLEPIGPAAASWRSPFRLAATQKASFGTARPAPPPAPRDECDPGNSLAKLAAQKRIRQIVNVILTRVNGCIKRIKCRFYIDIN